MPEAGNSQNINIEQKVKNSKRFAGWTVAQARMIQTHIRWMMGVFPHSVVKML